MASKTKKLIYGSCKICWLFILIFSILVPHNCFGGGCHVLVKQQVVAVAAVAYTPIIVARVGDDLERDAAIEKALREREEAAAQGKTTQQYQKEKWDEKNKSKIQQNAVQTNLLFSNCSRCHKDSAASAGSYWSMKDGLTGEQGWKVMNMLINGKGIPKEMTGVVADLKKRKAEGALLDELYSIYNQVNPLTPTVAENESANSYGGF